MSTRNLFRGLAIAALVGLVAALSNPLAAWFTGKPVGGGRAGEPVASQAGDLRLSVALEPRVPREKGNALLIEARDLNDEPLERAEVKVTWVMPAMGAMAEMRGEAKVSPTGAGRYRAEFDLPMGGTWTLEVGIKAGKVQALARYTFTVGSKGLTPVGAPQAAASDEPFKLSDPALEYSRAAFNALDSVRALLAKDTVDGVSQRAGELGAALRSAAGSAGSAPTDVASCLREGAQTADRLATVKSLDEARERFAELAQYLIALAAADPRVQEGWQVFQCPMAKGFNKWFQRSPRVENPYMGQQMLTCGTPTTWTVEPPASEARGGQPDGEIAHHTCPMHPSVKSDAPGACPSCGMDLTPVTHGELASGVIHLDEARRQRIGVQTGVVRVASMDLSFRALGRVTYDETALKDVTLKLDGYIQKLHVDATGVAVKKGDVLFTLYSPELYAAQQEYLLARNSQSAANASLVRASRKRLELWGLTPAQIDRIAEKGEPLEDVPFLSPASGYVIEKNVVEGAAIKAGEKLFRVAPLQTVWVEADVYEQQLPLVRVGQQVEVTLPYLPGETYRGRVAFLYPSLDAKTRTGKIRIELPNPKVVLKPDMYANVRFVMGGKPALQVPESAVIYTGPRRLVFLDLGEGRLRPQEVKLGMQGEGSYEVLEGLKEGDRVVTSGNFLIAAESRIRSAADYWTGDAN